MSVNIFSLNCKRQRTEHFTILPLSKPMSNSDLLMWLSSDFSLASHWPLINWHPQSSQLQLQLSPQRFLRQLSRVVAVRNPSDTVPLSKRWCPMLVGGGEEGPVGKETAASFLSQGTPGRWQMGRAKKQPKITLASHWQGFSLRHD